MRIILIIVLVFLIILGTASAIAKIFSVPEEVAFFNQQVGIAIPLIIVFGVAQLAACLLLIISKYRRWGALLLGTTFLISALILLLHQKIAMGLISILPILLTILIFKRPSLNKQKPETKDAL